MPQVKAAIYTHSLTYEVVGLDGAGDTLTATVSFDDQKIPSDSVNQDFDSDFITNISYTFNPSGASPVTISYSDFTDLSGFDKFSFVRKSGVTPVFDGSSSLFSTIDNLQFGSNGGAFALTVNGTARQVNADAGDDVTDFLLEVLPYLSPAPLPILGIIPAFSTISRLKRRYKLKNNS